MTINRQQRILFIGLGLIGGSIALSLKKAPDQFQIFGYSEPTSDMDAALTAGIIDQPVTDLQTIAEQADVIFLATPVKITQQYLAKLATFALKETVIVTDTGSTKQEVVKAASLLTEKGIAFIGGHPMAGSHKSGLLAARVNLFENAYYLLTPTKETSVTALTRLEEILQLTDAKLMRLSSQEHDAITGMLSHFPHIVAAGLVNQTDLFLQEHAQADRLAAGGFRDITRIASSDPTMWTEILLSNQAELLKQVAIAQEQLSEVASWIASGDHLAIHHFFAQAKAKRDSLPVKKAGALPAFYDLLVDVPDYPGSIAAVTSLLAQEEISLINIKILETREDIMGILQVTFKNQADQVRAQAAITAHLPYHCIEAKEKE